METCSGCQAPLLPETRFCVQCGRARETADHGRSADRDQGSTDETQLSPYAVEPITAAGHPEGLADLARTGEVAQLPSEPPVTAGHDPEPSTGNPDHAHDTPSASSVEPQRPRPGLVSQTDGVPTLDALPPTVRNGLGMGVRIAGAALAVGFVTMLVAALALVLLGLALPDSEAAYEAGTLATDSSDQVSAGLLIKSLFTSIIQLSGMTLFGASTARIDTLGEYTVTGATPLWPLVALLVLTARIAGARARRSPADRDPEPARNLVAESGIAGLTAAAIIALLNALVPFRHTLVESDGMTVTGESSVQVGGILVLGSLVLAAVVALVLLREAGFVASLRRHPFAPVAARVATVLRDHFAFAYLLGLPAMLIVTSLVVTSNDVSSDLVVWLLVVLLLWGPGMMVNGFISMPIATFGVFPSFEVGASAGSSSVSELEEQLGREGGIPELLSDVIEIPGYVQGITVAFGALAVLLVGLRWGLRQSQGWHAQWGTAWLLPAVYFVVALPLWWFARTSVSGSISVPFVGDAGGSLTLHWPAYALLLMAGLGLGVETVARIGTPWLERAMPGLARRLSADIERPGATEPRPRPWSAGPGVTDAHEPGDGAGRR